MSFPFAPHGIMGGIRGVPRVGGKPGISDAQAELVEGCTNAPLRFPAPQHLALGQLAEMYQECDSDKVRDALRWLPTIMHTQDPERLVLREQDAALVREPPFTSTDVGTRFTLRVYSGTRATPAEAPQESGVEVGGVKVSYRALHAYCAKGTLDERLLVSDAASYLPTVFLRVSRLKRSEVRWSVRKAWEATAAAHARGLLTLRACWVSSAQDRGQLMTSSLQTHAQKAVSSSRCTLAPLFSASSAGVRAVHETLLRRHVLLYTARTKTERETCLRGLPDAYLCTLWNHHASCHPACLRQVGVPPPVSAKRQKVELSWDRLTYKQKQRAPTAMATCLTFTPPAGFPTDLKWSQTFDRHKWREASASALDVPQTRDCRRRADWQHECAEERGGGTRVLVTNTAADTLYGWDGIFFFGNGGRVPGASCVVSWRDLREWCLVDWAPVPTSTRVVELHPSDLPHLPLLVQWFPLVCQPTEALPDAVHPHTRQCAKEYAEKCQDWEQQYEEALAADRKRPWEDRVLGDDERRTFVQHKKAFRVLAKQYEALSQFPAFGSDQDPGDHTGEWLTPL